MPSIINSDDGVVSGSSGLKSTGGNDGILVFQSSGAETARITSGVLSVSATSTTASTVRLYEDTDNGSNYVDLIAPTSVAANRVITFPDATTTLVGTDTTQTLTGKTLTSPTLTSPTIDGTPVISGSLLVSGTAVNPSGALADFTGIPSWVKRVTLMFSGVAKSGTSAYLIQIGTSGGVETTGYTSSGSGVDTQVGTSSYTTGYGLRIGLSTYFVSGAITILNVTSNTWVASYALGSGSAASWFGGGTKSLSGTLDRIRITSSTGTDTFLAGTVNILYE